ncbi:RNA-guided endonuclease TnpB family protein [Pseudomonas sp. 3A(2025)]
MKKFAGCVRVVWNKGLALQQERHAAGEKKLGYAGLCKELTAWRNSPETPWLAEASVDIEQQVLRDLETAHKRFIDKHSGFPRFKKKGSRDSFRFPQPKSIRLDQADERILLPKLGWLKFRKSRKVLGLIRNVTVSLKAGHWYVSILTDRGVSEPSHPAATVVGIDLGIVRFATLWDGQKETVVQPLSCFKRHEHRLAKAQRQMSRKVKFSSNWKRAKSRVQKIHVQIANVRNDFLHKTSNSISKNHAMLCVEDLQVKNMSRSASGSLEKLGRNVRAKSGLNKSILNQGWGEFRRQLDYKSAWQGGWLVAVPAANTSRECPTCGHTHADNRKSQSVFLCVACGHTENADLVASKNIRERGLNCSKARTLGRIACEVSGVSVPPAAGTHRSEQPTQVG